MCRIKSLQNDTTCDGLLTDIEESLSMSHSGLTTSDLESSVARAFSALLEKPSGPSTVAQASRVIRSDWRFFQQNTDEIAQRAYATLLIHRLLSKVSENWCHGDRGRVYIAVRELCVTLKLAFGESEESPLDMELLRESLAMILDYYHAKMLGDVQSEFLQAASQYRKICVFISELTFRGVLANDWQGLMTTAMNRALDNIPSGLMTRLGAQKLPIWSAYLSGANAWIENTDAEVVQETLASQCICKLQWSRWEERFRLASVTADNRGLPKLSEATLRVATQIRSTMEKVAAQEKFLLTYKKVSRGQVGLTRVPSINVVTTLH